MKMCVLVMLALGLSSPAVSAPEPGKATGHMMINSKTFKLTHVYARAMPGSRDKKEVEILVILSDVAISAEDLASAGNSERLATAGNGAQQPMRLTGLDVFETKTDDGKTIAGRHSMASPHKFSDIGNGVTFQDDVTFSAPVAPQHK